MSNDRPQNPGQLSHNLPGVTNHITGHTPSGTAIVESSSPATWTPLFNSSMGFSVVYTTSTFPPSLTNNADIDAHHRVLASGDLGLVNPGGTVARMVDFAPGSEPVLHRTQSLDYGLVVEGEMEMVMDEGVTRVMGRGDVAVQRGTNHGWRNTSKTEWARMFFVLQDCQPIEVGGKVLGEDITNAGGGTGDLPSSKKADSSKI